MSSLAVNWAVERALTAAGQAHWEEEAAAGLMESSLYPELGYTPCVNGFIEAIPGDQNNTFKCSNVSDPPPSTSRPSMADTPRAIGR